jgi:hypothetical protein
VPSFLLATFHRCTHPVIAEIGYISCIPSDVRKFLNLNDFATSMTIFLLAFERSGIITKDEKDQSPYIFSGHQLISGDGAELQDAFRFHLQLYQIRSVARGIQ